MVYAAYNISYAKLFCVYFRHDFEIATFDFIMLGEWLFVFSVIMDRFEDFMFRLPRLSLLGSDCAACF